MFCNKILTEIERLHMPILEIDFNLELWDRHKTPFLLYLLSLQLWQNKLKVLVKI